MSGNGNCSIVVLSLVMLSSVSVRISYVVGHNIIRKKKSLWFSCFSTEGFIYGRLS